MKYKKVCSPLIVMAKQILQALLLEGTIYPVLPRSIYLKIVEKDQQKQVGISILMDEYFVSSLIRDNLTIFQDEETYKIKPRKKVDIVAQYFNAIGLKDELVTKYFLNLLESKQIRELAQMIYEVLTHQEQFIFKTSVTKSTLEIVMKLLFVSQIDTFSQIYRYERSLVFMELLEFQDKQGLFVEVIEYLELKKIIFPEILLGLELEEDTTSQIVFSFSINYNLAMKIPQFNLISSVLPAMYKRTSQSPYSKPVLNLYCNYMKILIDRDGERDDEEASRIRKIIYESGWSMKIDKILTMPILNQQELLETVSQLKKKYELQKENKKS